MMESKWISCKERMPEKSEMYLVTIRYMEFGFAHVQTLSWSERHRQWNNFDKCERNNVEIDAEWNQIVTHWMELPEPAEVDA